MNSRRRHFPDWYAAHRWPVLVTLVLVGLLVYGFIQLADEVMEGETQRLDEAAVLALRNPADHADPIGPPWLEESGRDLTALGGFTVMTLVIGSVVAYLFLSGKPGTMWLILVATLGALLLSAVLKRGFHRPRPDLVPHLSNVYTTSFPSGHSMNAAAVYLTLGFVLARVADKRSLKIFFLGTAFLVTMLVGVSRVYMGVHYPSDVVAGWAAGLAWAVLCLLVTSFLKHRGQIEQSLEPAA